MQSLGFFYLGVSVEILNVIAFYIFVCLSITLVNSKPFFAMFGCIMTLYLLNMMMMIDCDMDQ